VPALLPYIIELIFLPQKVRREKDPRSLLRQAPRRDGPRRIERRSHRGSQGDDAAFSRLTVVVTRYCFRRVSRQTITTQAFSEK